MSKEQSATLDVNTKYQSEPVCPYCGHVEKDAWEISENATEHDCNACGETMCIDKHVSVTYSTGRKIKKEGKIGFADAVRKYGDGWLSAFRNEPNYCGLNVATILKLREWSPGYSTTQSSFDAGVMYMAETCGRSWQVRSKDINDIPFDPRFPG